MKITLGEWYAEDRVERRVILAEGSDYEIASIEGGAVADETGRSEENIEADATLIAAAPNLLAACVAITENPGARNHLQRDLFDALVAAVKKARGE